MALATACAPAGGGRAPLPEGALLAGVAAIDITPREPIRLAGYANRTEPTSEVSQPLRAKALVLGGDEAPSVLVTLDLIGVPAWVTEEVARRLAPAGVERSRLVITATHTHNAPELAGVLPTHLTAPRSAADEAVIRRYTDQLVDRIEQVALAALDDCAPGGGGATTVRSLTITRSSRKSRRRCRCSRFPDAMTRRSPGAPMETAGSPTRSMLSYALENR